MNKKLKLFTVFYLENIGTPEDYIGGLNVIAEDIDSALKIAQSYGKVKSIHGQDYYVVTTAFGAA